MTEIDEVQALPEEEVAELPIDDLEHYTGEWVAMRGGHVVAHHPDPEQLRANPEVRETDDVFPVGEPPSGFYLINV